jgi:hypothetical protein
MGGIFDPIIQGQIDGRKNGLQTDLSISLFVQKSGFDLAAFSNDYWIGFGSGYTEGQHLRNNFKKISGKLLFEEYISCCQYLFLKTQACRISPQHYLDNTDNWYKLEIEYTVCKKTFKFIEENKTQRALNEIFEFYKTNFRLKALKDFDILVQDLKNLRSIKKKDKQFNISEEKTKIICNLKEWLYIHGQHKK